MKMSFQLEGALCSFILVTNQLYDIITSGGIMSKLEWNLKELFINNEEFNKEIKKVKRLISKIKKYKDIELDSITLLKMLNDKWKIKELNNNILVYASLMYYKNINNEECINNKKIAENFNNEVNTELKFIDKKILDLGFDKTNEFISKNEKLKIYKHSLNNLFRLQEHIQNDNINQKIKENNNNINNELNIYNDILKNIKYDSIKINDKEVELNATSIGKYLSSRDRNTRKETYFALNNAYIKDKEEFAKILDTIYENRINNAFLEKYNSVLEKTLYEENIDIEIIDKLIKSVNNNLSLIQSYLKIKSNILEIEEPHLYDFNVPLDNNLQIKYTINDAKKIIINALKPLGSEYIKIIKKLFKGHIDAELNENKHQSITFSWNTYSFMNFRGSYVDIKNMIHEIGHIVNYYLSMNNEPFIYADSTIFVGETASIVNEILLNRYLYNNAKSVNEKIFYLSKEIENYFTSVFKQTMYTEFENNLYEYKKNNNLTSNILSEIYNNIIKKYYGDNVIYDDISNIEWTRLGHLYRWSYYPYKYATGLLIASVVVDSLVDKNKLSKKKYIEFLSSGSNNYSLDLLKIINIDLINTDVIKEGFNILENDINKLNNLIQNKREDS